jgi:hypothetical protein
MLPSAAPEAPFATYHTPHDALYPLPEAYDDHVGYPYQYTTRIVNPGKGKGKQGKVISQPGAPSAWLGKGIGLAMQPRARSRMVAPESTLGRGAATLPRPSRPLTEDVQKSSTAPTVPLNGWTVIWCDEMAFKATSHVKRDELEGMGIRVKAHKTAERCIRSLDKRAKKLSTSAEELPPVGFSILRAF